MDNNIQNFVQEYIDDLNSKLYNEVIKAITESEPYKIIKIEGLCNNIEYHIIVMNDVFWNNKDMIKLKDEMKDKLITYYDARPSTIRSIDATIRMLTHFRDRLSEQQRLELTNILKNTNI